MNEREVKKALMLLKRKVKRVDHLYCAVWKYSLISTNTAINCRVFANSNERGGKVKVLPSILFQLQISIASFL